MNNANHFFENSQSFRDYLQQKKLNENLKLFYKNSENQINNIKAKLSKFLSIYSTEDIQKLFILTLTVSFLELYKNFNNILKFLLNEPHEFKVKSKLIIKHIIDEILLENNIELNIEINQIHVNIKFDIGVSTENKTEKLKKAVQLLNTVYFDESDKLNGCIEFFSVILAGYTVSNNYIIQSIWNCTDQFCPGKISTDQVKTYLTCPTCSKPLEENKSKRLISDYRYLKVYPVESVESPDSKEVYFSRVVEIQDYLFESIHLILGHKYIIIGYYDILSKVFKLWNIIPIKEPLRTQNISNSLYNTALVNSPRQSITEENERLFELFSTENSSNALNSFTDSGNETGNSQINSEWVKVKQEIMNFDFDIGDVESNANTSLSDVIVKHDPDDNNPFHTSEMQQTQFNSNALLQCSFSHTLSYDLNETASNTFSINTTRIPNFTFTPFPPTIHRLYSTITSSHSEFAFVYALSAHLCDAVIPTECFINLKLALLLSIISCNYKPIPIMAIGTDTSSIHSVIKEIGYKYAKRFIFNQPNDYESVKFMKDKWIEAGPSLLARNGVSYLGDISIIKASVRDRILKEIEDQEIGLNIKTTNLTFKLESAIWCYWDKSLINLKENEKVLMYKFLEVFGMPIAIDAVQNDSLLHFILGQPNYESVNHDFLVPTSDLKEYISQITNRQIPLAKETSDLLDKYFITSRSRGRLTQKGFVIINRFAESIAKLLNHNEILPIDAISAIFLAEQSIQEIFGPDAFPCPKFKLQQSNNLLHEIDEFMKNFTNWLLWYCSVFKDK